jgi:hypothetical protein
MPMSGAQQSRAVVFVLTLIVLLAGWWWMSQKYKQKLHVFVFGSEANPYISNLMTGITTESEERDGSMISVSVFDVAHDADGNAKYNKAIERCEGKQLLCRMYDENTLHALRRSGKRAVVICTEDQVGMVQEFGDVVAAAVVGSPMAFDDDVLVVVPSIDFPPPKTNGAVVSLEQADGTEIDKLVRIARDFQLRKLYVYENGTATNFVSAPGLNSVFDRIYLVDVQGREEGKQAMRELHRISGSVFGSHLN